MSFNQYIFKNFSLLVVFWLVTRLLADEFTNPPNSAAGLMYQRGSQINITWHSDLERVTLVLWHSGDGSFEYLRSPNSRDILNTNCYSWIVDTPEDISKKTFSLGIFNPGSTTAAFDSSEFSIIDTTSYPVYYTQTVYASSISTANVATITSSGSIDSAISESASSSSISAAIVVTTISSVTRESATAEASSSNAKSTQSLSPTQSSNPTQSLSATQAENPPTTSKQTKPLLSTSLKTGIGIGAGIGVPLVFAMGIFAVWKLRGERSMFASSGKQLGKISSLLESRNPHHSQHPEELEARRLN